MLNLLENVFIPYYGAGVIIDIGDKIVFSEVRKYVVISLVLDSMSLYIPESKINYYRIREIVNTNVLNEALAIINNKPVSIEKQWNKRYRENNEKLASGIIYKECEVIRDLHYLNDKEIMPPGEQKILQKAEALVCSEIMLVKAISMEQAFNEIRNYGK